MTTLNLGDVELKAPAGYSVRMLILAGPPEQYADNEQPYLKNVVVARESVPPQVNTNTYGKEQMRLLKQSLPGFQEISTETVRIAGENCPLVEAHASGPNDTLLATMTTYWVKNGEAFTLTGSHLVGERFDQARDEFVKIFSSLVANAKR